MTSPTEEEVGIRIAPPFMAHVTRRGIIEPQGTIQIGTNYSQVGKGHAGFVFTVTAPGYSHAAGFTDEAFYMERNGYRVAYPLLPVFKPRGDVQFFATWTTDHLRLTVIDESFPRAQTTPEDASEVERRTISLPTPPILPPNSLLVWARRQAILPTLAYDSAGDFYQTVLSSLDSIQDAVTSLGAVNPFWDMTYEGSRILTRLPKHETDVHPTINAFLFSIAAAKNLLISPEYPISGGRLDFLVSAPLSSGALATACLEFKLAHAPTLLTGLTHQLPAYMTGKGSDYGIYAVLFFKGPLFHEPKDHDPHSLKILLELERRKAGLRNIVVYVLDLSQHSPPSHK